MNTGRGYRNNTGLEAVRTRFGEKRAAEVFAQTAQKSKAQAAVMLNDQTLRFRTFFVLIPHIKANGMYAELNLRGHTALRLCADMLGDEELKANTQNTPAADHEQVHNVLKWIIRTGVQDDGDDNSYAKIMDNAAALIADRYHDATVLPLLVDMLFRRARAGFNIHDLAWALFHGGDPHTLRLAAGYLRSNRAQDYELACLVLHLEPLADTVRPQDRQKQYDRYLAWLNENYDYLYPTEESFQLKSDPEAFAVDVSAKYLARPTLRRGEAVQVMAAPLYNELPREFLALSAGEQKMLANYSNRLYRRDRQSWNKFIALSVTQQVITAKENVQTEGTR